MAVDGPHPFMILQAALEGTSHPAFFPWWGAVRVQSSMPTISLDPLGESWHYRSTLGCSSKTCSLDNCLGHLYGCASPGQVSHCQNLWKLKVFPKEVYLVTLNEVEKWKAAFSICVRILWYETPCIDWKELMRLVAEWRISVISTNCCFEDFPAKFN